MPPMIEVRGLSKQYHFGHSVDKAGNARELMMRALTAPFKKREPKERRPENTFWALKDIGFNVDAGEIVGIIGANGAGKSTLLKILSRITDPTEGRITLRGRMASLLEVGTGFHPELTGRENIFMNGAVLGMRHSEIKKKFDEIVAFAEIEKFLDTPVKRYSSGMSVRLGFAVAAHLQPEILIVDEVLAVGDMSFQKKCLGKMSEVSKNGRTVLFVSHNMAAVENLCQRGIVLQSGRMIFDGETKSAVGQYLALTNRASEGEGHEIDLSDAPTRKPRYAPIMRKLELFTGNDEPAPRAVQVGARLKLKVHLRLPRVIPTLTFAVGINNMVGQRVLTLNTLCDPNLSYGPLSGETVVVCEVPSLTLVPGEYFVSLFVDFGAEQTDVIMDAFALTVLDGNYFGVAKPTFSGVFVVPHSWSVEQVTEGFLPGVAR
ncbi:MAG: ABC transporter ATP-binding protein [Acidobacteriota bacterium]|nr:ABC transporter ATP-binding protein [Acidobacteriota bacterium]